METIDSQAKRGKVRRLTCCCCGNPAGRWRQHWNRDTGYGICFSCADSERKAGAEIISLYGVEGVNWGKK